MGNLLNKKDRDLILDRISGVSEDLKGSWGKMTAGEMIVHLADPLRVAIGEKESVFVETEYSDPSLRHKIIYVMTWPRDSPTSPEFMRGHLGTEPVDFSSDIKSLKELINIFSGQRAETEFSVHPTFGDLSNDDWGCLMWKHIDHHLTQFGL